MVLWGHAWLLVACMVARGHVWLLGGHAWLLGGMHGCWGCVWLQGACMVAGGHAWLWGRGHAWLLGGHVWLLGGMHGCRGGCIGYDEIRSMSGRYASYWNAFLFGRMFAENCINEKNGRGGHVSLAPLGSTTAEYHCPVVY